MTSFVIAIGIFAVLISPTRDQVVNDSCAKAAWPASHYGKCVKWAEESYTRVTTGKPGISYAEFSCRDTGLNPSNGNLWDECYISHMKIAEHVWSSVLQKTQESGTKHQARQAEIKRLEYEMLRDRAIENLPRQNLDKAVGMHLLEESVSPAPQPTGILNCTSQWRGGREYTTCY